MSRRPGTYAADEIGISETLPTLDRTVFWLTSGYEASRRGRPPDYRA